MKTKSTTASLKTTFGSLWNIYSDESVYSICIDAYDDVYYYQKNESKINTKLFKTKKELNDFVARLLKYAEKKIEPSTKSIFLSIGDYTKINIIFPPIAMKGPALVINKLPAKEVTLDDLVKYKALEEEGKALLVKSIDQGKGILVAGNPGSGKTTLLNTLLNAIPQPQRVVTVERYPDLVINRDRVSRLQTATQTANEMTELVEIAGRMYPDYLVISNFEGPEVMGFLEIGRNMCSTMGLITGQNPLDALKRLETKAVLSSEGMSLEDARYAISQAFQHVVFQERTEDGKRLVSSIGEIHYDAGELKVKIVYKR